MLCVKITQKQYIDLSQTIHVLTAVAIVAVAIVTSEHDYFCGQSLFECYGLSPFA